MHGRLDLLEELLARCLADAEQRGCAAPLFILLGDYIDRGPDSAGVLAFLRQFEAEHRVVALVGNHDAMFVNTVLGDDDGQDWAVNGMSSTVISYGHGAFVAESLGVDEKRARIVEVLRSDQQVIEDACWLAGLPLVHEDEHRIFVHAGLRPGVELAEQTVEDVLWIRKPFLRSRRSFGKLVVHGHTPTRDDRPEVRSNRVGLDTSAYASGVLTAAVFDDSANPVGFLQTAIMGARSKANDADQTTGGLAAGLILACTPALARDPVYGRPTSSIGWLAVLPFVQARLWSRYRLLNSRW